MNNPEPEVISQVQKGNQEAFTKLVELYQRPVYNLCYRMLGNPEEAEDISQETFLKVYKNANRYDSSRPFTTWILSVAAHLCIDQLRKRRMTLISMDANPNYEPVDVNPGPDSIFFRREEQRRVQSLLQTLNPQDRAAVVMYYWYDFSYDEIAHNLSMTSSAVKSRLHRARIALAQTWSKQNAVNVMTERNPHESSAL